MESKKNDFKAPPSLDKDISYTKWKKELAIWETFTNLESKKRAPAIFLTLEGQARDAVLEMEIEKLSSDDGVKELLKTLDVLYLKDECTLAYEAYESFEKYIRPADLSINEYIIQFERLYNKAKSFKMEIHDGVLAYRLLNNANLNDTHKQLIRATVSEMNYKNMKDQLNKIFASSSLKQDIDAIKIKSENAFYSDSRLDSAVSSDEKSYEESFLAQSNYRGNYNRGNFRGNRGNARGNFRGRGNWKNYNKWKTQENEKAKKHDLSDNDEKQSESLTNPINRYGQILRCMACDSQKHMIKDCPNLPENKNLTEKEM